MTMNMDLHPQYITNEDGKQVSVILPIEEYKELIEQYKNNDLSHLTEEVEKGFNFKISTKNHKEIFQSLKQKYA